MSEMTNLVELKSMILKTDTNECHQYHKNQTQITHMICRLNDHMMKHLVTQHYRKYHKDTK